VAEGAIFAVGEKAVQVTPPQDPNATVISISSSAKPSWTTAREASGCISKDGIEIRPSTGVTPYAWYEGRMDPNAVDAYQAASEAGRSAVIAANMLNRQIATQLRTSVGAPTRYAPGQVGFGASRIATQILLDGMGPSVIATRLAGTNVLGDLKLTGVNASSRAVVDGITQAPLAIRRELLAALTPPNPGSGAQPPIPPAPARPPASPSE
jgi:hypothetical protein